MTPAARQEIEASANRHWWQFWKTEVVQSMKPNVGLKNIEVKPVILYQRKEEEPEVILTFDHFGYRDGVAFSGYPQTRRFGGHIPLSQIENDPEWRTKTEYDGLPAEQKQISPEEAFITAITFP